MCVCEEKIGENTSRQSIVSISLQAEHNISELTSGWDFYSNPRLNSDFSKITWLTWNHPNMPWDTTILWSADINPDGKLFNVTRIAGGENESIFQPEWASDGSLYYISDINGWWNIYRHHRGKNKAIIEDRIELGEPQWRLLRSTYILLEDQKILCYFKKGGLCHIGFIEKTDGIHRLKKIETPFSFISYLGGNSQIAGICAASSTTPLSIMSIDVKDLHKTKTIHQSISIDYDIDNISKPLQIEFLSQDNYSLHGLFYKPVNVNYQNVSKSSPPLLLTVHPGPTSCDGLTYDIQIQYWTTRGFAYLAVNYRGSTGFGRDYRQSLKGHWGVYDVNDCIDAIDYLKRENYLSDQSPVFIRGGSAGGFTTLVALSQRHLFKGGACYYGISDLTTLIDETHRFERDYFIELIGNDDHLNQKCTQLSAINFTANINVPIMFVQGLEDRIVPPDQTEKIVDAISENGGHALYLSFGDEQHGIRKAYNYQRALEQELLFYQKIIEDKFKT